MRGSELKFTFEKDEPRQEVPVNSGGRGISKTTARAAGSMAKRESPNLTKSFCETLS